MTIFPILENKLNNKQSRWKQSFSNRWSGNGEKTTLRNLKLVFLEKVLDTSSRMAQTTRMATIKKLTFQFFLIYAVSWVT